MQVLGGARNGLGVVAAPRLTPCAQSSHIPASPRIMRLPVTFYSRHKRSTHLTSIYARTSHRKNSLRNWRAYTSYPRPTQPRGPLSGDTKPLKSEGEQQTPINSVEGHKREDEKNAADGRTQPATEPQAQKEAQTRTNDRIDLALDRLASIDWEDFIPSFFRR